MEDQILNSFSKIKPTLLHSKLVEPKTLAFSFVDLHPCRPNYILCAISIRMNQFDLFTTKKVSENYLCNDNTLLLLFILE